MIKRLLTIILGFSLSYLSAQTDINLLRNQFNTAYDSGHYSKALLKADDIIAYWKSKNQKDSTAYYTYKHAHTLGQNSMSQEAVLESSQLISQLEADPPLPNFMGSLYFVHGKHLLYLSELAKAQNELNKSITFEMALAKPDTFVLANAIEWKGIVCIYTDQLEEAQQLIEEALRLRYSISDSSAIEIGYTLNSLAGVYHARRMLAEANAAYEETYRILKLQLPTDHPNILVVAANLSNVKSSIGEISAALQLLESAIAGHEKLNSVYNLMNEYNNLGSIYFESLNDEKRGRTYFLKSLQLADSLLPKPHFHRANIYDGIGGTYLNEEDYQKADSLFLLGYRERKQMNEKSDSNLGRSTYNLGLSSEGMGDTARAAAYYRKSFEYLINSLGAHHPKTANSMLKLADLDWAAGRHDEALRKYRSCLKIYTTNLTARNAATLQTDIKLASRFAEINFIDSTNYYLEMGWKSVCNTRGESINLNKLSEYEIQFADPEVLNLIEFNLDLLIKKKELIADKENEQGLELMKTMDKLMDGLWPMLNFENQTSSLLPKIKRIYNKGIMLASLNIIDNEQLKSLFLNSLEQSQSVSIRSALQNRNAMHFANVPDSMIEKDRRLREKLRFIQAGNQNDEAEEWEKLSFATMNEWRNFQVELHTEYPEWYSTRYAPDIPKIAEVQKELTEANASLVADFVADTSAVILHLEGNEFQTTKIELLAAWRDSIRTFRSLTEERADAKRLASLSYYIYTIFWQPIERDVKDRVMLIADGALNFLNFETLVSDMPATTDFSQWNWLIKKHTFLYRNSLPGKTKQKPTKNTELLAFAPGFSDELKEQYNDKLDSIQFSDSTFIHWVQTPWSVEFAEELKAKGKAFIGQEATKSAFRENAAQAEILHFGTHAKLNDLEPLNSYLALTPQPQYADDGYLYAYELYNQPLNAQLAVLTACQTGLGTYREGDGVISIAHAFQYAGCPNVVYSLWQIDEKQSTWLMKQFYENLDANQSFSDALHNAKLNYLDNHNGEMSAPYYWGGVVLTGTDGKLASTAGFIDKYWWIVLLGTLGSVFVFFLFRKRQKVLAFK